MGHIPKNQTFTGTVLWFSDAKGYGFIETTDIKDDSGKPRSFFCHYSRIQSNEDYKTLSPKSIVEFEVGESTKGNGWQAINVRERKIHKSIPV